MKTARGVGLAMLLAIAGAAAAAPVLGPNPPTRQFPGVANTPPMIPRVMDADGFRPPFVYPWRVVDPLERRFEPDRARPHAIRWFQDGRVWSTAPEPWLLLGADPLGRDLWSRLLAGARLSLGVAACAVVLALALGALIGALAGFLGGWPDRVITAVADFAIVLPLIYVVLTLRSVLPAVLEPATVFWTMVLVMALATWPVPARGVRTIVAAERKAPYAEAAYAVGGGPLRILLRHLLPATAGHLKVQGLLLFPAFIFAEATLSFVGLGFAEPSASWGVMLQDAAGVAALSEAPWLLAPAAAIVLTVAAITLVADNRNDESVSERHRVPAAEGERLGNSKRQPPSVQ